MTKMAHRFKKGHAVDQKSNQMWYIVYGETGLCMPCRYVDPDKKKEHFATQVEDPAVTVDVDGNRSLDL